MKRLILLFLPFVSICINAEELKFVTVLSSPVGTFNKLEAVNPAVPAKSPTINFCTSIGNGGTVTLQAKDAAKHPTMNTVNMSSNTELGGNGANYVLSRITMNKGGALQGSRLLANTLQVGQSTAGKSENLYINNLTVAGAKTGKLYVNGTESYIETSHTDPGMVWSNQYQNDKACGSTTECSKQYLLKERRISSTDPCAGEKARTYWNGSACVCPSAGRPSPVGYLPEYDTCCYLDGEKKEPCWKKEKTSTGSEYKWKRSESKNFQVTCNGGVCWLPGNSLKRPNVNCSDLPGIVMLYDKSVTRYCNHVDEDAGKSCDYGSATRPCIDTNTGNTCAANPSGYDYSATVYYNVLTCEQDSSLEETWQPQWF